MLELKNISFSARGESDDVEILRNIDLTIPTGKFIVITGPNGGGKSTLAKVIMGVEQPTEGRIYLDGEDVTDLSVTERAKRGISYGFQAPPRFKGMKVSDLLSCAAGKNLSHSDGCRYLTQVGLCSREYIDRDVDTSLSGGELKRIEIATILARGTKLSVFDEPEAGIDLWSFQNLIEVFERMRRSISDSSILIISHQERILSIADEIVVLKDGRVDRQGPKDEILPELIGTPAAVAGCRKTAREVRA